MKSAQRIASTDHIFNTLTSPNSPTRNEYETFDYTRGGKDRYVQFDEYRKVGRQRIPPEFLRREASLKRAALIDLNKSHDFIKKNDTE